MGDKGLDYAFPPHPAPSLIAASGYRFVSRYLSYVQANTVGKILGANERDALLAEGVDIFLNWEFDSQDCLRGAAGGTADATEAIAQAKALGYPAGATIYHSADFDVTDAQKPVVAAYMEAARVVERAAGYRTGCYSGYWTIKYLFDGGHIDDGWQTYAWSGGQWDARAAVRQEQNGVTIGGADCDVDERVGLAYSWLTAGGTMSDTTAQQVDDIAWVVDAMAHVRPHVVGGRWNGQPCELSAAIVDVQNRLAAIEAQLAAAPPSAPGAPVLVDHTHTVATATGPATATPTP